jgi:Flp pilus assembly pilin Flp
MDAVVSFIHSWPGLIQRAFIEHSLIVAFVSVAAIGVFVILQQELRPNSLFTNIAFVAGGWLIAVTAVVFVMGAARKGWAAVEQALPFAAKLSAHIYGICERHPLLALAIVAVGTTAFFLKRAWPIVVMWTPVRAACTLLVIALAIHVAGPIADMVDGEPVTHFASAKGKSDKIALAPVEQAVAQAIKAGDRRYVSVRQCVDEVSGYPVAEAGKPEIASPWTIGVKPLGASCYDSLGHEGSVRMNKHHAYAVEYNRRMYEHNRTMAREMMSAR